MSSHIEVELKWILPPARLSEVQDLLTCHLGQARILNQDNRYYDSRDGRLQQQGCALRIRRENQQLLCTWKECLCLCHAGIHEHRETNISLAMALWPFVCYSSESITQFVPLPDGLGPLLGGQDLMMIGAFSNQRLEFSHQGDLLHLDRTTFPNGQVETELEIESTQPEVAAAYWRGILASLGIDPVPQPATKLQRMRFHR